MEEVTRLEQINEKRIEGLSPKMRKITARLVNAFGR